MPLHRWIAALVALALLDPRAGAQPATAPTTAPAPRVVTPPPGFFPVVVNGIRFLAEPADEAAVRAALADAPPATMPSTRPSDMLDRLAASREQLKTRIMTDLALADPVPVDKFLDETLTRVLVTHRDVKLPMIFLVTSEARLKELLRGGWSDPRFYYNRAADGVEVNWNLNIVVDRPPDESLVPAIYNPADSTEQRQTKIAQSVRMMEQRLADYLAGHAGDDCYNAFMDFLLSQTVEPVKNKLDREWITAGICGVLTTRYSCMLTGRDVSTMLLALSADRPDLGLPQSAVNLIQPMERSQMRPGAVQLYMLVYTRKAIRVCNDWIKQAGDAAIPRLLAELRKNPPDSGAALVEQIKQSSGIDLTSQVGTSR